MSCAPYTSYLLWFVANKTAIKRLMPSVMTGASITKSAKDKPDKGRAIGSPASITAIGRRKAFLHLMPFIGLTKKSFF